MKRRARLHTHNRRAKRRPRLIVRLRLIDNVSPVLTRVARDLGILRQLSGVNGVSKFGVRWAEQFDAGVKLRFEALSFDPELTRPLNDYRAHLKRSFNFLYGIPLANKTVSAAFAAYIETGKDDGNELSINVEHETADSRRRRRR